MQVNRKDYFMSDKKTRENKRAEATIAAHAAAPVVATDPAAEPTVTFTVSLPTSLAIRVAEGKVARVPVDGLDSSMVQRVLDYGIGRYTRDGTTKIAETDADGKLVKDADGKQVMRDATPEERVTLAEGKWGRLVSGEARQRAVTADPLVGAMRTLTIKALRGRGVANKAIPKLPDRAAMVAALAPYAGLFDKVAALAVAQVKMMAEAEAGLSID